MRGRCLRPTNPKFYAYGGRGIRICDEWSDFQTFRAWAMSSGYRHDLTIERNDVNGNYEPGNCTWAGADVQGANKRNVQRAPDGEPWLHKARRNGIKDMAYRRRLSDGWSAEEAATSPMWARRAPRDRDKTGRYV